MGFPVTKVKLTVVFRLPSPVTSLLQSKVVGHSAAAFRDVATYVHIIQVEMHAEVVLGFDHHSEQAGPEHVAFGQHGDT